MPLPEQPFTYPCQVSSTGQVLIKSLGCDGISKSQVSRICQDLDQVVETFLGRPLDGGPYP